MRRIAMLSLLLACAACAPSLSARDRAQPLPEADGPRAAIAGAATARTADAARADTARTAAADSRAGLASDARRSAERPLLREQEGVAGRRPLVPRATDVFGPLRFPRPRLPR